MKYLKLLCSLTFVFLNLSCYMEHTKKITVEEIRTIIENQSSVEKIQAEVDNLFSYYGDEKSRFDYEIIQIETPTLINLSDTLNGRFIGIQGTGVFRDNPGYVSIRFNGHRNVQFLMIFKSDEDLSIVKSKYKHIINNIYVRD